MATLPTLVRKGILIPVDVQLPPGEFPDRGLYLAPPLDKWIDEDLAEVPCAPGRDLSPYEQVYYLFTAFVRGDRMYHSQEFNKLIPQSSHVWEMKTTDVRIFGYFYRRLKFIAVCGDLASRVKKRKLYQTSVRQCLTFRDKVGLSPPPYATGDLHELI